MAVKIKSEMERLWGKAVVVYLEKLLQIYLKEKNDTSSSNVMSYLSQDSNLVSFQHQAIALPVETTCAVK